jgi:Ca2+/Na+ antiporter
MLYLAMFHWGWLLGAFLLGLGMGWIAVVRRGKVVSRALAQKLSAFAVVLIGVSLAKLIPGRFGYWLDLGLALFAFYLVGCAIGSWLRDWVVSRPAKTAAGS